MEITEAVKAKFETVTENMHRLVTDLQPRIKALEEVGQGVADLKEEAKKRVDENTRMHDQIKAINDRVDGVETKMSEHKSPRILRPGQMLIEGFKSLTDEFRGRMGVEVPAHRFFKDVTPVTNASGVGDELLISDYNENIIGPGQRRLTIRDLLASGTTARSSITFMQEKAVTGGPDYQSTQGEPKADASFTFEQVTEQVATVAVYTKIARQMMSDVPALSSYIQGRMRFMLEEKAEDEILDGSGNGDIHGINTQADAFDVTLDASLGLGATGNHILDILGVAAYQVSLSHFPADGIVLNPREGWALRLLKRDPDGSGGYLFGDPGTGSPNLRPWGIPVVETQGQTAGNFTVGAFRTAAQLFMRENVTARISSENEDDFIKNLVTLLVELRAVLAVYRPSAFVTGDFTTAAS